MTVRVSGGTGIGAAQDGEGQGHGGVSYHLAAAAVIAGRRRRGTWGRRGGGEEEDEHTPSPGVAGGGVRINDGLVWDVPALAPTPLLRGGGVFSFPCLPFASLSPRSFSSGRLLRQPSGTAGGDITATFQEPLQSRHLPLRLGAHRGQEDRAANVLPAMWGFGGIAGWPSGVMVSPHPEHRHRDPGFRRRHSGGLRLPLRAAAVLVARLAHPELRRLARQRSASGRSGGAVWAAHMQAHHTASRLAARARAGGWPPSGSRRLRIGPSASVTDWQSLQQRRRRLVAQLQQRQQSASSLPAILRQCLRHVS